MNMKIYPISAILACAMLSACSSDDNSDMPGASVSGSQTVQITAVDYNPAPGQFVNEMPVYLSGMTRQQIQQAALADLQRGRGVSLGAFGGYIVMELAQPIRHRADGNDFKVLGNAFKGSAEPGVVEVSTDGTQWYALAGQNWDEAQRDITITYHLPVDNATPQQYIRWTTDNGHSGWIMRNPGFHTDHSYFPEWEEGATSLSFTATRLPDNWTIETATGNYYGEARWGYADSYPNTAAEAWLNLANAVDDDNRSVTVDNIRYIKVSTGVINSNPVTGECSTEVMGIQVLND